MRAIVLTFDRLPAQLLSSLGNEWIETPTFDRLAAKSRVFEQHVVEIPAPAGPAHPWWSGHPEFFSSHETTLAPDRSPPLQQLRTAGITCQFMTERLEGLPSELFSEAIEVCGENGLQAEPEQVPFAKLIHAAIERLQKPSEVPTLLWLHSRGVPDQWTPPRVFAELYVDELDDTLGTVPSDDDDEPPPAAVLASAAQDLLQQLSDDSELRDVVLSDRLFTPNEDEVDTEEDAVAAQPASHRAAVAAEDFEIELLLRRVSKLVFGGYVSLLDHWLAPLVTAIETSSEPTLFIVSAACGQAFGDRDAMAIDCEPSTAAIDLQDAVLRTPLFVWRSDRQGFGSRHQELHQPEDLPFTLLEWFGLAELGTNAGRSLLNAVTRDEARRTALHLSPNGAIGIREPGRLLVADSAQALETSTNGTDEESSSSVQLFVKPSDVWNVFDIASQEPDEVERLTELLRSRLPP